MEKFIVDILEKLENLGFKAYVVGGYVRDKLLKKKSFDIDIITSASPNILEKTFNQKQNNFGGINFKKDNYDITITTFREESNYKNGFPTSLNFITDLKTDLLRRDFTINAICLEKNENLIDYYDGIKDLNNKVIRIIGDIDTKINEDISRIFRAVRFAITLDFTIEENLKSKIKNTKITKLNNRCIKEIKLIKERPNFNKYQALLQELNLLAIINLQR